MPAPFEALKESLLRGGIAPRHVRRYLRELSEHLADLTAARREAGIDADEAAISARAALGPEQELADAMLKQRDFRSISARFPWAVFLLMPPLGLVLGFLLWVLAMVLVGFAGGVIPMHHKIPLPIPSWYAWTGSGLLVAANFLIAPSLGLLLAWMAQRQRMKPLWPLVGMGVILLLNMHADFHADNRLTIGLGTTLSGPGGIVHWPTFLGQAALLCLPAAWVLWTRRKSGAPQ